MQNIILEDVDRLNKKKWDYRFLEMAKLCSSWSKDPSTKVGAVIVSDRRRIVSVGYNGFPRGVEDREDWLFNRETKLKLTAHAERNALDNAECSVVDGTLYTTLFPCNECAKSILQRKIKKVVSLSFTEEQLQKYSFDMSILLFKAAGVEVVLYDNT